ncbi:hypothetical protein [Rhodoplanes azumiensis]|uniref:Uncharacterized protein n=1 Tax=Rhodoplanes azumiensis TaxID=1897628 RepID=A0ABW5AF39_9BRAD
MSAAPVTRRAFLAFRLAGAPARDSGETITSDTPDDPFASYDIACALVNEARPFLADEARRYGISMENRTDLEICKAIFAKAAPPTD